MGNCLDIDAPPLKILYPSGRVQWRFRSVTAEKLMMANPGHRIARVNVNDTGVHAKLLKPRDKLVHGGFYKVLTPEEVMEALPNTNRRAERVRSGSYLRAHRLEHIIEEE